MHTAAARTEELGRFSHYVLRRALPSGGEGFVYLLCPQDREAELCDALEAGHIPPYALLVAAGEGEPDEKTRHDMERCYGFTDHVPRLLSAQMPSEKKREPLTYC